MNYDRQIKRIWKGQALGKRLKKKNNRSTDSAVHFLFGSTPEGFTLNYSSFSLLFKTC